MTQDEVDLIYDYLHANYEYRDGELIRKKDGHVLGCFKTQPEGHGCYVGSLAINKTRYTRRISHLIWLYHHKKFPKYIKYLDDNKTNTKIENLKSSRIRQHKKMSACPTNEYKTTKFQPSIILEGEYLSLGNYKMESDALKAIYLAKKLADEDQYSPFQIKDIVRELMGNPMKIYPQRYLPLGVRKAKNKYRTDIRINGIKKYLGAYKTPEEAHAAYLKAKEDFGSSKK